MHVGPSVKHHPTVSRRVEGHAAEKIDPSSRTIQREPAMWHRQPGCRRGTRGPAGQPGPEGCAECRTSLWLQHGRVFGQGEGRRVQGRTGRSPATVPRWGRGGGYRRQ